MCWAGGSPRKGPSGLPSSPFFTEPRSSRPIRLGAPSCSGRHGTFPAAATFCTGRPRRMRAVTRNGVSDVSGSWKKAGPEMPAPSYESIDSQPLNKAIMSLFRRKMVDAIGTDSHTKGYDAIVDLTRMLNSQNNNPRDTQIKTRQILLSLFPSWLPPAFKVMFSEPLPSLSCQLNAWVTMLTCQWLMGPCKVNDVEVDGGKLGMGQGVLVERCRYLEETGCASVCLNSCKIPTQEFFAMDMGLPLTMTPNYEDFSCQFSFGLTPKPATEDEAFVTPCFVQCPSKQRHRGDRCPGADVDTLVMT